jgi:hypothetical protein
MTEREKFILRAALIYAQSNLGDLNEAFESDSDDYDDDDYEARRVNKISVNGDFGDTISESEVDQLLMTLQ